MRLFGRFIGKLIWYGFGAALYGLWILSMFHWLGGLGAFLAVVLFPGAYVFPFIYWLVEGGFPVLYVVFWAASIVGVVIACISREPGESGRAWVDRHS